MALTAAERTGIRKGLGTIMDDEHADALVANLPDGDTLVTKDFLRAELAGLRADLEGQIGGSRAELTDKITEVHKSVNRLLLAIVPALIAGMGLAAAIGRGG